MKVEVTVTLESGQTMNVTHVQQLDRTGRPVEARLEVLRRANADAQTWIRKYSPK
jgi:hypothetical protein